MLDFHAEEHQAQQDELLIEIIEDDERNGGCSKYRSAAYQMAFAACMTLTHEEDYEGLDAFFEHVYAERARLTRQGTIL